MKLSYETKHYIDHKNVSHQPLETYLFAIRCVIFPTHVEQNLHQ